MQFSNENGQTNSKKSISFDKAKTEFYSLFCDPEEVKRITSQDNQSKFSLACTQRKSKQTKLFDLAQ